MRAVAVLLTAGLPIKEIEVLAEEAGELVCDVWTAAQTIRAQFGKTRRTRPCPEPARYPGGVYCAKHAGKMICQATWRAFRGA
jgi:hypothetical protein